MTNLKQYLSLRLKEAILQRMNVPFSRHFVLAGLESGFVPFPRPEAPVSLVDVGSCSGQFTSAVVDYCGVSRGLLIEPQPDRFRELSGRFTQPTFTLKNCAIADRNCTMNMDILQHDFSSSLLPVLPDVGGVGRRIDLNVREKLQVAVRTLDDLLRESKWDDSIDLLKIDVQGAELKVLKGASDALQRTHMVLAEVSFRPQYEGSAIFSEVYEYMLEAGFLLTGLQEGFRGEHRELLQADAVFTRSSRK